MPIATERHNRVSLRVLRNLHKYDEFVYRRLFGDFFSPYFHTKEIRVVCSWRQIGTEIRAIPQKFVQFHKNSCRGNYKKFYEETNSVNFNSFGRFTKKRRKYQIFLFASLDCVSKSLFMKQLSSSSEIIWELMKNQKFSEKIFCKLRHILGILVVLHRQIPETHSYDYFLLPNANEISVFSEMTTHSARRAVYKKYSVNRQRSFPQTSSHGGWLNLPVAGKSTLRPLSGTKAAAAHNLYTRYCLENLNYLLVAVNFNLKAKIFLLDRKTRSQKLKRCF